MAKLIWVANQHDHFARCKHCDLKNVLYYSQRHGVLAAGLTKDQPGPAMHTEGQVILDSGCRTAVAGWRWHSEFQAALRQRGVTWKEIPEHETFQFGAGGPEVSEVAFVYPVGIYGKVDIIRMSAVSGPAENCPGLVGPSELSRWGVCFDFAAKSLEVFGQKHAMVLSATRHPALYILDFPAGDPWNQPGMQERSQLLERSPQSLVVEGFEPSSGDDVHEVLSFSSETSAPKDPHFFSDFGEAARKRKVEYWLGLLESDLGVKVITDLPDGEETPTERSMASSRTELRAEGGSDGDTITSHEFGLEIEEEEETEPSEASDEELVPDLGGKPCFFHKGLRQRVKQVARDIHLAALGQLDSRMNACQSFFEDASRAPEMSSVKRTRRPGPWRMVEIFTWTMVVGMAACAGNWEVGEPIVEPGFNILETADQERANQYLKAFDPDFVMISYPGCCWEPLLSNEACDPKRCAEKGRERNTQRPILAWIQHVVLELRKKGVAILGEASYQSDVWREPVVIDTWCGMSTGRSELCAFGLRRPDNEWGQGRGLPLRRPIRLVGTHDIVKNACQSCPGNHRHAPSLGGVCVSGQWCPLDGFCGGYPRAFARKVVGSAEKHLKANVRRTRCDPYGG